MGGQNQTGNDGKKTANDGDLTSTWDALKSQGSQHYKTGGVEPVDLYLAGGMFKPFALCSIIKYAFRSREVDGEVFVQNMRKIIDYAEKLIAAYEVPK